MQGEYHVVGKRLPRVDAADKATGRAVFGADFKLPGMLYGKIVRSRHPHARIVKIDTSKAEKLPGVYGVITAADQEPVHFGLLIRDRTPLAVDKVRFVGEEVAAVAAATKDIAEEAANLIEVKYKPLPAVHDPEEALRKDAPVLHDKLQNYATNVPVARGEGNICARDTTTVGDPDRGFREADEIIEGEFSTQIVHQGYIEPHAATAKVDQRGGVTIWTSTQATFWTRQEIAAIMGVPLHMVNVIPLEIGGGFGGKISLITHFAVLLARKTGRPVQVVLTREEELSATRPRHAARIRYRTGVKRDGAITAMEVRFLLDTGAYADFGPMTAIRGASAARGPYRVPNGRFEGICVYTNKPSSGAYRAPGFPQFTFALESHMDEIAERLGMDPVELRLRNGLREGDVTFAGERLKRSSFHSNLKTVAERIGWGKVKRNPNRGIGIASGYFNVNGFPSGAAVKINEDGTINVITGAVDLTGTDTALTQIVAEELGVPPEDVRVTTVGTDAALHVPPSGGSMISYNVGNACRIAAQDARRQLFQLAAEKLGADPDDMVIEDRMVYARASRDKAISIADLAIASQTSKGGLIVGKGTGAPLPPHVIMTAQAAEVEVDPETGQVRVLRFVASQDVGRALNPASVEGQIHGGVAQGLGFGLMEKIVSKNGTVLNPSFLDYHMPTSLDVPNIETILIENPTESGPYGARGVGEPPHVPPAAAVANAICNATGVRMRDLPITPERLSSAIKKKGGGR